MHYDDYEDDLRARFRHDGVSPVWRVVAVIELLGLLGLLMVVGALTAVLAARSSSPSSTSPVPDSGPFRSPFDFGDPDEDEADDPTRPYPMKQDLRPAGSVPVLDGEPTKPAEGPQAAFRKACEVVWTGGHAGFVERVAVSPDGSQLALIQGGSVFIGPPDALMPVPLGASPAPRGPVGRIPPGNAAPSLFGWSTDGGTVYLADEDGKSWIHARGSKSELHDVSGPVQGLADGPEAGAFLLVRARSGVKVPSTLRIPDADPSEVVYRTADGTERILVAAQRARWRSLALSPDGKTVALRSNQGHERDLVSLWRVFLLPLAGGPPRPVSPPSSNAGTVCWAPDGRSIIYDREIEKPTAEDALPGEAHQTNLYELDVATGRESRLTWGGNFSSPSVTRDGHLYCVAHSFAPEGNRTELLRLPLARARELAARPELRRRTVRAWVELAQATLKEAGLPADLSVRQLDGDKVAKIAAAFARQHRARMGDAPPDTAVALDTLRSDLAAFVLGPNEREPLTVVLGVAAGEYLRRKHGARWDFSSLADKPALTNPEDHDLFRTAVSPFAAPDPGDRDDFDDDGAILFGSLRYLLQEADGRPIVLTPRTALYRQRVPAADPDLARGITLLESGKEKEADTVLVGLCERHRGNLRLALHVATRLYDRGRSEALARVIGQIDAEKVKDARAYNLLGVSLLKIDPAGAVEVFRKAIRCDLRFGAAYLNLAEAYRAQQNPVAARECLERYLTLAPYGPASADVRRRLAELDQAP